MLGLNAFAAETDREGARLLTSLQQAFLALRRGMPGRLPPPVDEGHDLGSALERAQMEQILTCTVLGSPESIRRGLQAFALRTQPDELMVTALIFDHQARLRSFEIVADVARSLA
jgi:alkanesulfonate monooxygenase SsuD/methylene tetrahydromethanopterin reductase-like flavin-dependent oxidoreductase (luciferase family)